MATTAPSLSSPDTNVAGALLRPTWALALCLMAYLMDWMAAWMARRVSRRRRAGVRNMVGEWCSIGIISGYSDAGSNGSVDSRG